MLTTGGLGVSYLLLFVTTFVSCIFGSTIQARAQVPTNSDILNLATDTFAVQLIGAQTNEAGLASLCSGLDLSRLQAEGYNVTALKEIFCYAASDQGEHPLPSIEKITANVIAYSSWIWISQAVGALKGDKHRLNLLCHLIDVGSAFSVGLNGTLAKDQICNVGNGGELPVVPIPYLTRDGIPQVGNPPRE
ncbi:MAG: hypothetical protein Q9211_002420 [Gyalolechia sp. 1 TL-2023]